ncbi:diguanylate cyclase [Campylobacter hyointestinalis subsp. hyointestinalis]|uniref:Diguanylate cyclase n=1 Tax=Campylobacter hyointestinalis subsp. hyointestinalis TaxID=91352 RepID=A0A0S4RYB5_CAMHY|nr:GGDEF domain-containing protein [Campylobacter hyointestinalis]CUU78369.1 diguanylate cyclase [Campylobacter hyointestinalis subsp. hyointestinalis]
MVKLRNDKDRINLPNISETPKQQNLSQTITNKNVSRSTEKEGDSGVDLNKFSQIVLKQLSDDNIQATPKNFDIYFWKLLETKPAAFQKRVLELVDYEKDDVVEQQALMEKEIKLGFGQIKNMLQIIALIYKNLVVMKGIVQKRLDEAKSDINSLEIQNIIKIFGDELAKLNSLMERHLDVIKNSYEDVDKIFKNIEEKSIYDSKFGVYNKKYFLKSIEDELESVKRYNYNVCVMLINVKDSVLNSITSIKDKNGILRNIAKILLKTSRRSDIVAHYGDGYFGMIMKHTDIEGAKKACERIGQMLYQTMFFIGEEELDIDIEISVIALDSGYSTEEIVSKALDGLAKSGKRLKLYEAIEEM